VLVGRLSIIESKANAGDAVKAATGRAAAAKAALVTVATNERKKEESEKDQGDVQEWQGTFRVNVSKRPQTTIHGDQIPPEAGPQWQLYIHFVVGAFEAVQSRKDTQIQVKRSPTIGSTNKTHPEASG
jgi:hypothetical protein